MNWVSYLFPQTLLITGSSYNRLIRVNLERGKPKLLVNGARESGEFIRGLWTYAFSRLALPEEKNVQSILVVGVAGGTVIHMLRKRYPKASITGIDIDQTMIDIGQKYFGLSRMPKLTLVCEDAQTYVKRKTAKKYDLIVLDIYIGEVLPDFLITPSFHGSVKTLLGKDGRLCINYEHALGYGKKAEMLERLLSRLYAHVAHADIRTNRFFMAWDGKQKI